MIRLHSGRLFATVLAFAILLSGVILTMPVFAQEGTPESDTFGLTEASPEASPVASPEASPQASPAVPEP